MSTPKKNETSAPWDAISAAIGAGQFDLAKALTERLPGAGGVDRVALALEAIAKPHAEDAAVVRIRAGWEIAAAQQLSIGREVVPCVFGPFDGAAGGTWSTEGTIAFKTVSGVRTIVVDLTSADDYAELRAMCLKEILDEGAGATIARLESQGAVNEANAYRDRIQKPLGIFSSAEGGGGVSHRVWVRGAKYLIATFVSRTPAEALATGKLKLLEAA